MPAWRNISLWMDQLDDPLVARPSLAHDLDVKKNYNSVQP